MAAKRKLLTHRIIGGMAIVALCLPAVASAEPLKAEGWGKTRQKACRNALASLAESLEVEVNASLQLTQKSARSGSGSRQVSSSLLQDVKTSANLPLLGTKQQARPRGDEFVCTARLDAQRARGYYGKRLSRLRRKASDLEATLEKADSGEERHRILTDLLALADRYERFAVVARFLGLDVKAIGIRSRPELRTAIAKLKKSAPSIGFAAKQLTQNLPEGVLYLTPPQPPQAQEVTPFARALESAMAKHLNTTTNPSQAQFHLRGEYEVLTDRVSVTYHLVDRDQIIRKVRTASLGPEAYDHLRVEPKTASFNRLLHQGLAVDNDFRARLATNRGREDLLFRKGNEIKLLIKLNRPGYYYLTGHTIAEGQSYSYLVPLQEARGARRFVRYLDAEKTNKWVNLGKFEVSPPYGVESIQMIASTQDLIGSLPEYTYDQSKGLYRLEGDAAGGVTKTRALKPKPGEEVKSTEAVLTFTTAP